MAADLADGVQGLVPDDWSPVRLLTTSGLLLLLLLLLGLGHLREPRGLTLLLFDLDC